MPILKGAVTFSRFRVEAEKRAAPDRKYLGRSLKARAFTPLDRDGPDERVQGFVELADRDATEFAAGELHDGSFALFSLRIDEIRIPSAALKAELERWGRKFQDEHQRPPGRYEKSEAKTTLRRGAFPARFQSQASSRRSATQAASSKAPL